MLLPILLVTATTWLLTLSLIAALCLSARQGDLQQLDEATATPRAINPLESPLFSTRITAQQGRRAHPCEHVGITARAGRQAPLSDG